MSALTTEDFQQLQALIVAQGNAQATADEAWKKWGELNALSSDADRAVKNKIAELTEKAST